MERRKGKGRERKCKIHEDNWIISPNSESAIQKMKSAGRKSPKITYDKSSNHM